MSRRRTHGRASARREVAALSARVDHLTAAINDELKTTGSAVEIDVTESPAEEGIGVVVGVMSTVGDQADSLRVLQALRTSEARKSAILALAVDAIITMDVHGTVVEFNAAAERSFGYSLEQARGRDFVDFVVAPDGTGTDDLSVDHYLSLGDDSPLGQRREVIARRANGSLFAAEMSVIAVEAPGPRFFTAFVRDLTERDAAAAEREGLEDRVHQTERLESLGQLAGGVAHDFNNLLTVILNYATFIAEGETIEPDVRWHAQQIVDASVRAGRLTSQLLTFARREPLHLEPVDLNAIVADVRDLLARTLDEHVRVEVVSEPDLPLIAADRGQIEQVLVNLAVNAREAMPDGGTLTITTDRVELDANYTRLHPEAVAGAHVHLSVRDTGAGMSPDVVLRAFEPFFTTRHKGDGIGLGLATVYGIVTETGGSIDLHSREGVGTIVDAYFPVTDKPLVSAVLDVDNVPTAGVGRRVLVVEDQQPVREVIAAILRRNGYEVLEANGAREALKIAETSEFDLLLTDVVMPETSGTELATELQRRRPAQHVLFMSGYTAGLLGYQQAPARGTSLIRKPFNEATLLQAVQTALA